MKFPVHRKAKHLAGVCEPETISWDQVEGV